MVSGLYFVGVISAFSDCLNLAEKLVDGFTFDDLNTGILGVIKGKYAYLEKVGKQVTRKAAPFHFFIFYVAFFIPVFPILYAALLDFL
jgi:hypothetical protein